MSIHQHDFTIERRLRQTPRPHRDGPAIVRGSLHPLCALRVSHGVSPSVLSPRPLVGGA